MFQGWRLTFARLVEGFDSLWLHYMKQDTKQTKKPRDDSKDTNVILACILKEMEDFNKYLKFMAKLDAADHGIELDK